MKMPSLYLLRKKTGPTNCIIAPSVGSLDINNFVSQQIYIWIYVSALGFFVPALESLQSTNYVSNFSFPLVLEILPEVRRKTGER